VQDQGGDSVAIKRNRSDRREALYGLKIASTIVSSAAICAILQIPARWLPRYIPAQDYYLSIVTFCLGSFLIWQTLDQASPRKAVASSAAGIVVLAVLLSSSSYRAQFDHGLRITGTPVTVAPEPPRGLPPSVSTPPSLPPAVFQAPSPRNQATPGTPYLPVFPSPSPPSSAFYVVSTEFLRGRRTFGDAAKTLLSGLEKAGYRKRSFFSLENNGIALVTRLEKINEDGTPAPKGSRWPAALKPLDYRFNAGIQAVLRGLFEVEAGHYRVIVFLLSNAQPLRSVKEVSGDEALEWLKGDTNTPPDYLAAQPIEDPVLLALIYEFESDGSKVKVIQSPISGEAHLSKAGILRSLGAS
jgi:hypothetical protein